MMRFLFAFTLLAPPAVLAGCADKPSDQDYDDIAASVGALVSNESGGEVGSMRDSLTAARGEVPAGLSAMGSGSLQGLRGGITYGYSLTCQSASGAAMAACDDTTDSARVVVSWSGSVSYPRYAAMVSRSGDWMVTGLQGDVADFSGMGRFDVQSELRNLASTRTSTFALAYSATYQALRFGTADGLLQSGSIRYAVNAKRTREGRLGDVERELDVDVLVTFQPDGAATIQLDGSRTYALNLTAGTVTRNAVDL